MSNEVATVEQRDIIPGFSSQKSFELSQRAARLLAASTLVPKEYQENIPNCVIALNMASRMQADPLMVMQNLFIVHGRPGWSSQFLISTFNTSGRFTAIRYEWTGDPGKDNRGCRAWSIEKATGERLEGSCVTIEIAKKEGWYGKNGSKWQTMPEQMLMYRAASWFIRAYAPELAMGMHTEDEIYDTIEMTPADYEVRVEKKVEENANREVIDIQSSPAAEPPKQEEKASPPPPAETAPPTGTEGPGF